MPSPCRRRRADRIVDERADASRKFRAFAVRARTMVLFGQLGLAGAPAGLLDNYGSERRPVGQQVVETSDKMFSAAAGQTGWEAGLRDWLAWPVTAAVSRVDAAQHRAFRKLAQLEIAYGAGLFLEDSAPGLEKPALRSAIARRTLPSPATWMCSICCPATASPCWPCPAGRSNATRRIALPTRSTRSQTDRVRMHCITRLAAGRDARVLAATSAEVFGAYGLNEREAQAIYLIRPDGYVARRAGGLDADACGRFLERFAARSANHCPTSATPSPT